MQANTSDMVATFHRVNSMSGVLGSLQRPVSFPPLAATMPLVIRPEFRIDINGGTPWNTQRDVRIQRRVDGGTKHRYFPDPRTGRPTIDLQLRTRRKNGFEPDQMMDEFAQHTISRLCRNVNRSMEGVMNQLNSYNGPWDIDERPTTREKKKLMALQAEVGVEAADTMSVKDRLFNVDQILRGMDSGEEQRKLNKLAQAAELDRQKDAKLDAQLERKNKEVIMWSPPPNRKKSRLLGKLDKHRRLAQKEHETELRKLHVARFGPPPETSFIHINMSPELIADQDPLIRAAKTAKDMCRHQVMAHRRQLELKHAQKVQREEMARENMAKAKAAEDKHNDLLEDIRKRRIRGAQRLWNPMILLAPRTELALKMMLQSRRWRDRERSEVGAAIKIQRMVDKKILSRERYRKIRNGMVKLKWVCQ